MREKKTFSFKNKKKLTTTTTKKLPPLSCSTFFFSWFRTASPPCPPLSNLTYCNTQTKSLPGPPKKNEAFLSLSFLLKSVRIFLFHFFPSFFIQTEILSPKTLGTLGASTAPAAPRRPRQSRLPCPQSGPCEPLAGREGAPGRGEGSLLRDRAHLEGDGRGVAGARPELREDAAS